MKISAQIILFLLFSYGASSMTPALLLTEKQENSSSPLSYPLSTEQSSEAKDNVSSEDETFIDLEMISFLKPEGSSLFHYVPNFRLQGSPTPPFSPPELRYC